MTDIFAHAASSRIKPLAVRLRPKSLADVVGQNALLRPGSLLNRRIASGALGSIILYGPPGIGKTTIARIIGETLGKKFRPIHPAHNNVSDIKKIAEDAAAFETLVFIDEIHRFNATQQDYLLSLCEDGVFDMIGATTNNPYHCLTKALVSRSTVFRLEALDRNDLMTLARRAFQHVEHETGATFNIGDAALTQIADRAAGDGRRVITTVESLTIGAAPGAVISIDDDAVDEVYAASPIPFDRSGDDHYDTISAFIKSMRGSDPSATLYWLARLIHAGEDPRYIARRLMVHASEDIGLADNSALQTAVAACQAVETIGYPEARIILAHAALHIALAPKSNSAYRGINAALQYVQTQAPIPVPDDLRDAHYSGAAAMGVTPYLSPHATAAGYVPRTHAPGLAPDAFYQCDSRSDQSFEARARDYWADLRQNLAREREPSPFDPKKETPDL